MKLHAAFADIQMTFVLQHSIFIEEEMEPFLRDKSSAEIAVIVSWDWDGILKSNILFMGEDLLQAYYKEAQQWLCLTKGGGGRYIANAAYDSDLKKIHCAINEKEFPMPWLTFGNLLRFLPMRAALQRFGVLFFHGAQVRVNGGGIVFTAPSGTGKSTQSNLWVRERGAKLICNDRTLVRKVNGKWHTYGYPVDGSAPVRSGERNDLLCIVLLRQGEDNQIQRLNGAKGAALLMPQLVIDGWNPHARSAAAEWLLKLVSEIPVYQLSCTRDLRAVECLEQQLYKDGVWKNE